MALTKDAKNILEIVKKLKNKAEKNLKVAVMLNKKYFGRFGSDKNLSLFEERYRTISQLDHEITAYLAMRNFSGLNKIKKI